MTISIIKKTNDSITLEVTIKFNRSMLDSENTIQDNLNEAGRIATGELLKTFDTEGAKIVIGDTKLTSKGQLSKRYQTPYGAVDVPRHVYQSSKGGAIFCPLERDARIILTSTPRFAAQISHKTSETNASAVAEDFSTNHNRPLVKGFIQRVSEVVSGVVQAKEESWSYHVPEIEESDIRTVSIGLDGTCMLMCSGSYRQAMVGTISLYDEEGERQHTTYIAAPPEYGKQQFKERLTREIERTKDLYPDALRIGLADGAKDNWSFLEQHTDKQTLDFFHATEYLSDVADSIFSQEEQKERKKWLKDSCHKLKHTSGYATKILQEMEGLIEKGSIQEKKRKPVDAAISYFRNNTAKSRMNYAENIAANQPIGSGVTEAACKVIVKQRLCKSGMRWKEKGAGVILSLRTLVRSTGRWKQFWSKVNQYGFPVTV